MTSKQKLSNVVFLINSYTPNYFYQSLRCCTNISVFIYSSSLFIRGVQIEIEISEPHCINLLQRVNLYTVSQHSFLLLQSNYSSDQEAY